MSLDGASYLRLRSVHRRLGSTLGGAYYGKTKLSINSFVCKLLTLTYIAYAKCSFKEIFF